MDKQLLKIDEAAAALSVSRAKLYQLIGQGIIPTVTLGTVRRVPASAIRELGERRSEPAAH